MNLLARWSAMIALAVLFAGCSNPAADVTAARVGDAQPVADEALATDPADPSADPAAAPAGAEVATFDGSTSKIGFNGSKVVGGGHDGGFETFDGRFVLDPGGEVRSVSATIDMNSIWSDNEKLTGHLKNQDFFEVDTYPEAEFVSTAIAPASSEEGATHEVTGNLTMHGQTKSITFPATVAVTDSAVTLDSEFKIDRTLWGVVYGSDESMGDRMIRKDVVLRLDIDASRTGSGPVAVAPAEDAE